MLIKLILQFHKKHKDFSFGVLETVETPEGNIR